MFICYKFQFYIYYFVLHYIFKIEVTNDKNYFTFTYEVTTSGAHYLYRDVQLLPFSFRLRDFLLHTTGLLVMQLESVHLKCSHMYSNYQFSSVTQSCPILCNPWTAACQASLSITNPRACSNSCPSSRWCHPTISSSVVPFSSCFQSFPASGSFLRSQFFTSGGQSIGASASILQWTFRTDFL